MNNDYANMVHWTPSRVRKIFYIATKRHCEIIRFKTLLSYIFGLELFTFLYTLHLNAYRPKILEFRPYPFSFMLLTTFSLPHGSTASRQEPGNRSVPRSVSIAAPFPYPRLSGSLSRIRRTAKNASNVRPYTGPRTPGDPSTRFFAK